MKFTIMGPPVVLKNSKQIVTRGEKPILVSNPRVQEWIKEARRQIAEQGFGRLGGDLHAKILTYAGDRRKRDLDNSLSAPLDAMKPDKKTGWPGVYLDDCQVKSVDRSRIFYDKKNPRVEITLEPYTEETKLVAISSLLDLEPGERLEAIDRLTANHERVIAELQKERARALRELHL